MRCIAIAVALLGAAYAIPVDNGVVGEPEIFCGPTAIDITFNTQNAFSGHVYVKNRFAEEGCRTTGNNGQAIGRISLDFSTCGVSRRRSTEPLGVFVETTVVISFHPRFLTKVDRAYTVQCFYMEADKTVSTDIEVSMITTGFQTQVVPMPVCRYEILDAAEGGNPVAFAIIGQAVFHKWTCDTDTVDTFCMTVHSCTVDDGAGDNLQLIDEDGCALDKYLMGNLDYPSDLMASKEVHVFKYADRPALFFNCQITITVKEPNGECARPECPEPSGQGDGSGARLSGRFSRKKRSATPVAEADVRTREMQILDVQERPYDLPQVQHLRPVHLTAPVQQGVCMSQGTFTMALVLAAALLVVTVCAAAALLIRRQKA